MPLSHTHLIFSQVLKEAGLESNHREGLVAFVVTEVLTEASRLQTASVEVSGAQAYTNQQVMDEFSRKLVECITDKPKDHVLIIHTRAVASGPAGPVLAGPLFCN